MTVKTVLSSHSLIPLSFPLSFFRTPWSLKRSCSSSMSRFAGQISLVRAFLLRDINTLTKSFLIMLDLFGKNQAQTAPRGDLLKPRISSTCLRCFHQHLHRLQFSQPPWKAATTYLERSRSGQDNKGWLSSALLPSPQYAQITEFATSNKCNEFLIFVLAWSHIAALSRFQKRFLNHTCSFCIHWWWLNDQRAVSGLFFPLNDNWGLYSFSW